jgi:hypothetical protein
MEGVEQEWGKIDSALIRFKTATGIMDRSNGGKNLAGKKILLGWANLSARGGSGPLITT